MSANGESVQPAQLGEAGAALLLFSDCYCPPSEGFVWTDNGPVRYRRQFTGWYVSLEAGTRKLDAMMAGAMMFRRNDDPDHLYFVNIQVYGGYLLASGNKWAGTVMMKIANLWTMVEMFVAEPVESAPVNKKSIGEAVRSEQETLVGQGFRPLRDVWPDDGAVGPLESGGA